MDTFEEVIDECPYDTSPNLMEDCLNENLDDNNKTDFIEVNDTGIYNGEG